MDDLNTQDGGAWALGRLGFAIDAFVDRQINKPTNISGNTAYGVDEQGRLYTLGQSAGQVSASVSTGRPASPMLLLLILGVAFMASRS